MIPVINRAELPDLSAILELQYLAYQKEAARYNDYNIPPLKQTLKEITSEFPATVFLKLLLDGEIIGSVKGKKENDTCHIGRLMVHPAHQRKGFGKMLMQKIENEFVRDNEIKRVELFTGERSFDNIKLYESQGYIIYKSVPYDHVNNIVYMEKLLTRIKR